MTTSTSKVKKTKSTKSTTKKVTKPIATKKIIEPIITATQQDTASSNSMFKSESGQLEQPVIESTETIQSTGGMFKLNDENNTIQAGTEQIADSAFLTSYNEIPVIAEEIPVIAEEIPVIAEEIPVIAEEIPVIAEEIPVIAEEIPVIAEEIPVIAEEIPVIAEEIPVIAEEIPVIAEEIPVIAEEIPVIAEEIPVSPIVFTTLGNTTKITTKPISGGSKELGIASLKTKGEFKEIDIDAIIAHTDPTSTGATITNSGATIKVPSLSRNLKKTFAVGGGVFILLGTGLWVLSTMYSAEGTIDATKADVLQAGDSQMEDVTKDQELIGGTLTGEEGIITDNDPLVDTGGNDNDSPRPDTQTTTNTKPSFGPAPEETSEPDLIEQVGEPSNALVDTIGNITSIEEKIVLATSLYDDAIREKKPEVEKYAKAVIDEYNKVITRLQNGDYKSNKDVTMRVDMIDKIFNKTVDMMIQ